MSKKIVVAIDLGTSRSAYAYSIQGRAEEDVIIRVPDGSLPFESAMKTETAVLLRGQRHEFEAFGRAARERFIEEAEDGEDNGDSDSDGGWLDESGEDVGLRSASTPTGMLFRWFKVELCQRRGYKSFDDPVAIDDGGRKVSLLHVMASVLRHFKKDAIAHLSSVSEMPQTVENVSWVLTVPAIYDEFGKRFMRVAAHKAGIISTVDSPSLQLCLEPEAACLAISLTDAPQLSEAGTKTMILDCGGGTVDITTHEVLSMNPLRLKEVLSPVGGPWGSTCVDVEFTNWCEEFLGGDEYARVRRTSTFYNLLTQWEQGKTSFNGGPNERVRLNMVDIARLLKADAKVMQSLRSTFNERYHEDPQLHVKGSKFIVVLPSSLVRSFFATTISNIVSCLNHLRRNESLGGLKYVFLVGGFSSSPLIQNAARGVLASEACAVVVAIRPDVAIVRGAVLFANNGEAFTTRKARFSYGVRSTAVYNSGDPEHVRRKAECPLLVDRNGKERIPSFSCHLEVGEDVPQGDGACPTQSYVPLDTNQSIVTLEVLASRRADVKFPDKDVTFTLGNVTVPVDRSQAFEDRGVSVQFVFGGTEISVNCFRTQTGERVAQAVLSLVQEVGEV